MLEFGQNVVKIVGEVRLPAGVDKFQMVKAYQDSDIEVDILYHDDDTATTETISVKAGDTVFGPITRVKYEGAGIVHAFF